MSFLTKLRKSFRYSLTIPIDEITKKDQIMDFDHHKKKLNEIIKISPILNDKRVILFYSNGYNIKFGNFPSGKSDIIKNLEFADLKLGEEHFFKIDGHLSKSARFVLHSATHRSGLLWTHRSFRLGSDGFDERPESSCRP